MQAHIEYINQNFPYNPKGEYVIKVLECLDYIYNNLDKIAEFVDTRDIANAKTDDERKGVMRAPNHMSFHVLGYAGYKSGETAKQELSNLHQQMDDAINYLKELNDKLVFTAFINRFKPSSVGCMNERVNDPLKFVVILKSSPNCRIPLSDLLQDFMRKIQQNEQIDGQNDQQVFAAAIDHFKSYIGMPILNISGEQSILDWDEIKKSLETICEYEISEWNNVYSSLYEERLKIIDDSNSNRIWYRVVLSSKEEAETILQYIKSVIGSQTFGIEMASVKYSRKYDSYYLRISGEQYSEFFKKVKNPSFSLNKKENEYNSDMFFEKIIFFEDRSKRNTNWYIAVSHNEKDANEGLQFLQDTIANESPDISQARVRYSNYNQGYIFRITKKQYALFTEKFASVDTKVNNLINKIKSCSFTQYVINEIEDASPELLSAAVPSILSYYLTQILNNNDRDYFSELEYLIELSDINDILDAINTNSKMQNRLCSYFLMKFFKGSNTQKEDKIIAAVPGLQDKINTEISSKKMCYALKNNIEQKTNWQVGFFGGGITYNGFTIPNGAMEIIAKTSETQRIEDSFFSFPSYSWTHTINDIEASLQSRLSDSWLSYRSDDTKAFYSEQLNLIR